LTDAGTAKELYEVRALDRPLAAPAPDPAMRVPANLLARHRADIGNNCLELFGGRDVAKHLILLPVLNQSRFEGIRCLGENAIRNCKLKHLLQEQAVPVKRPVFPFVGVGLIAQIRLQVGGFHPRQHDPHPGLEATAENIRNSLLCRDRSGLLARSRCEESVNHPANRDVVGGDIAFA
jgi:hypothetical protein